MRRRQIEAVWHRVGVLLRVARSQLPAAAATSRAPGLRATLREFDAFAAAHEWEHAWDALAQAARILGAEAACWRLLAEAAALMGLHQRRAEAERAVAGDASAER